MVPIWRTLAKRAIVAKPVELLAVQRRERGDALAHRLVAARSSRLATAAAQAIGLAV